MQKRSKDTDFKCLEDASVTLLNILRADEGKRDLDEQFRSNEVGHHRYFLHPYTQLVDEWGPMFEVSQMIPLPQIVQDDLNRQLHTASFMGIIPEINRAWVTIDSKIIFWNYLSPNEVDRYDGLRDIILSVSISAPKPGVFLDSVKYVLVVATTVEVVLMAVSWDDAAGDLKIIPTTYSISTDSVPMLKVTGTQSGRVFMGGQDGNLYELTYENAENKWASLVGMDGTSHKCQKVNHNAWSLTAVLPPFLRSILSAEQSIVDIVSDDVRRLLYIVTSSNGLRLVYTGPDGKSTSLVVSNFDLEHAVRLFLNSTGKHLDTIPRPDFFQDADSFQIVNLFVVPVTESKSVHAVLSLRSGTRIYLQLSTWSELTRAFGPYNHTHGNKNVSDARLDVAFVRGPPTAEAFTDCRQKGKVNRDGYLPANSLANVREQKVTLSSSYYSHGVFLAALKNQDALLPDELYGVGDDCTNRRSSIPVGPSSAGVLYEQPVAGLRESLCPVNIMDGRVVADYKVFDIKESCRQIHSRNQAPLWTLSLASGTPVAKEVQGKSSFKPFQAGNKLDTPSFTPLTYSTALAAAGHADVTGVSVQNASFVLPLSEFTTQALPLLTQRQFLCLTRFGMLVVKKRRPLDYLVKCLLTNDGNLDNQAYFEKIDGFFKYYGHVESLCMCLELMCDVPLDKLGSTGLESLQLPPSDVRSLRERLRAIVYRMGGCAGFETLGRNGATDTSRDNRLSTGTIAPNFFFSHRYDAFSIVLGRVLRPVWLKPLVDNRQLSPIWSTWVLTTIRRVSEQLRHCIAEFYPLAVKNDFFSPERVDENGRNVHTAGVNSGLITDRLFLQQHLTQDPNKRFQAEAIEREDTSMSAFWRVLCRSHQALTLVHLLVVIENVHKVKVNWSELGDVSFRTFVVSPSVHDKAKRMLHGVVTSILKNGDKRMEAVADEFTQKLTEDCYLYFSAGDRYAYEVSKHVDAMRAQQRENPMGVPRGLLQSQTDGLLYLLLKACKFWVSLEDVRDEDGKESLLSTYCRMLKELGAVGKMGIVRLCLATATNFGASMSTGEEAALIRRDEDIDGASNDWDRAMYHVGSVLSDDARKEALEACQNCLLRHLEETLRLDQLLPSTAADSLAAERMVDTLMEGTSDPVLRRKVFEVLLRENVDEILHLRSPDVQQFLLEEDYRYNYECLYKYLEFHGMYRDAANYMCNLAHTETPTHVEQRIRFLRLGVDSASRAAEEVPRLTSYSAGQRDRRAEGAGSDAEFLSELQDELLVREYQLQAYEELKALRAELLQDIKATGGEESSSTERYRTLLGELTTSQEQLESHAVLISALFNEVAVPYCLWDLALCLLRHSGLDAPDEVRKLWKSIIYRRIPNEAASAEGKSILAWERSGDSAVFLDPRHQCQTGVFEDTAQWLPDLESTVQSAAAKVYGATGTAPAFFTEQLLELLEDLAINLTVAGAPVGIGWAARLLLRVHTISYPLLVDVYVQMIDTWARSVPEKMVQNISSLAYVLSKWIALADERSRAEEPRRLQLLQVIRSGYLHEWLNKLELQAISLQGSGRITRTSEARLLEAQEAIARMRRMLVQLALV